ncbi:hypothetical protein NCC49_000844 [Naganishia albida]|nr:hypothetical protein NCC49_000844 [Naganishia albida]
MSLSLVDISPKYVAGLFKYAPEQDGDRKAIPTDAKLRPAEGASSCRPSKLQTFLFESNDNPDGSDGHGVFVKFNGEPDAEFYGAYVGDELFENGDNEPGSAWTYIMQYTFLHHARKDAEAGQKWINTDAYGSVQQFNGIPPQAYSDNDHLKHMLGLVVGKETSRKSVTDLSNADLKKTFDLAHESPVMVIPKKGSKFLDSSRIWIASKKVEKRSEIWEFFNPIDKKKGKKELSLQQIKDSAASIVFIKDHSSLNE